ncbi:hypothetical protein Yalta_139 [Yalta virus]|nr:hypothetical protein Yalta_139 [Yalta virus]
MDQIYTFEDDFNKFSDDEDDNSEYNIDSDVDNTSSDSNENEYLLTDTEEREETEETEEIKLIRDLNNIHIKDDFESVITLSNSSDIVLNKKIQQIKQTIDTLLSTSFTLEECVKVHSIYNFNLSCLQNRNRFLQEFILILIFMEHIGICFTKHILSLVFPKMLIVPKKKNYERIKNYIVSRFDFSNFDTPEHKQTQNVFSIKIDKYASGVLFYIKNRILLGKEIDYTKEDQVVLSNLLLKNKNNPFISDPKLRSFNTWLSGLMKNLVMYNMYHIYNNDDIFVFNKKKTIEYHIGVALRIVLCFMTDVTNISAETKYIKFFLFYRDDKSCFEEIVLNPLFQHIIKDIIGGLKKEETLKIFKKQFISHIKNVLLANTSIEQ